MLFSAILVLFADPNKDIPCKIILFFPSIIFPSPACLLFTFSVESSFLLRNVLFFPRALISEKAVA